MPSPRKKKGRHGGKVRASCIQFKWKSETIYLPEVLITRELRRIANDKLKESLLERVSAAALETGGIGSSSKQDIWDPAWDDDESEKYEGENDIETKKAETETITQHQPTALELK